MQKPRRAAQVLLFVDVEGDVTSLPLTSVPVVGCRDHILPGELYSCALVGLRKGNYCKQALNAD